MAFLLVDLHRNGVFWGDCSLANTLFRRDGDRIQAYLVDAETSEVYPALSDGQRAYDLEILVENVAFGLADLAAMQGGPRTPTTRSPRPSGVRDRYRAVWTRVHDEPILRPGDRQAIRARVRRLNELGYSVDLDLDPTRRRRRRPAADGGHDPPVPRPRARAADQDPGARGPGPAAAQRPQRVRGVADWSDGQPVTPRRRPTPGSARSTARRSPGSPAAVGPDRDLVQAYCDVLEQKWFLSEAGGPRRRARRGDRGVRGARRAGSRDAAGADRIRRIGRARPVELDLVERGRRSVTSPTARMTPDAGTDDRGTIGRVSHDIRGRRGARHPRRGPAQGATARLDAVDGVSFEVAPGEVFGLLGPNGAGKTTTVEVLEGLREPDRGDGPVLGIDVVRNADDLRAADRRLAPERGALPEADRPRGPRPLRGFYPRSRHRTS